MSSLLIYKASAGSGKTFTLAVEYIKLLIQNPIAYRQILAVTFTNKATGEMKERILSQLYGIATDDQGSKAYLQKICEELDMSPEAVRQQAQKALTHLIHDYSRFQVTTIDSFFQTVMRNLARELGLGASMNIELDTTGALDTAVDTLIEQLDLHSPVFTHILTYIEELIAEDKTWKIIDSIKEFGRDIFREEFMELRNTIHAKLKTKDFIPTYKKLLSGLKKKSEMPLQEITIQFFHELEVAGLDYTVFKNGARGIGSYFCKLRDKNYSDKIRTVTVEKCLLDINEWRTKKSHEALTDKFLTNMQDLLIKAEKLRQQAIYTINSCNLSLEHINKVSLLAAIDEEVHAQNRQKNRFLLAETNILLRQLIQDGDSSFVYEKIGTNIQHVMIDEFQDTSRLQWKNFKLLLIEGLSQGADSLIVGDVKQAIYRWRSGDWGILNNLRGHIEAFPVVEKSLKTNRRSEEEIIRFNNKFFTAAISILNQRHLEDQQTECLPLLNAYKDVCQDFPENKEHGRGYIKICFPGKTEEQTYEEATLQTLADEVKHLMEQGIQTKDIAILVRKNRFIPQIANYFETALPHVPVISNEAYKLDASPALLTLIQALRMITRPDDMIACAHLAALCQPKEGTFEWNKLNKNHLNEFLPASFTEGMDNLRTLPLYELLEKLVTIFSLQYQDGQAAYLMTFFDAVTEYLQNNPADYDSFLRHWDERLHSKTIPAGNMEGLHIYSIHNSKGLEFHTVLIPFCNWEMENERPNQTVWCTAPEEPYNHLDLLPIRYGNDMNQSTYHETFLKERLELWVDNLNILYVAFTRATANLIVLGEKNSNKSNISTLMQESLAKFATDFDPDTITYEQGSLCLPTFQSGQTVTNPLIQRAANRNIQFESHNCPLEFRQSNRSANFIRGEEEPDQQELYLHQGRLLHHIFSAIRTINDVEPLLQQMEMDGLFSNKLSINDIHRIVTHALSHPEGKQWFTTDWELLNERAIINRNQEEKEEDSVILRRPDRVMLSLDRKKVIVVDFKFGTPRPEYTQQVSEYMQLLQHMGYPDIKGYLWYVYKGDIEEVKK